MNGFIHRILGLLIVLFASVLASPADAQDSLYMQKVQGLDTLSVVSVRNNVVYLATGTPTVGVEVAVAPNWSLGVDVGFKFWDRFFRNDAGTAPRRWRNLSVAPTVRWYPRAVGEGLFLAVNGAYIHYNVGNIALPLIYKSIRTDYRQGAYFGGGVSAGYAWQLGSGWRIEAEAGLLAGGYGHDLYYVDSKCRHCAIGHETGFGLVPKIGLGVVYTFGRAKGSLPADPVTVKEYQTMETNINQ